jgi:uncharacterized protein (TIGR03083 family)
MDPEPTWRVIADERRGLADLLDDLDERQWETPSLCDGWRVREVAAHVAMAPTPPGLGSILVRAVHCRGDFNRLNYRLAIERAEEPTSAIVASIRDHADSRRLPLITNCRNIHFDILVHTQDIVIPLGLAHPMPVDAAREAAAYIWGQGWPFYPQRRLAGKRLVADDVAFQVGDGAEIRGPISALLLLMSGRVATAAPMLTGAGVTEHA